MNFSKAKKMLAIMLSVMMIGTYGGGSYALISIGNSSILKSGQTSSILEDIKSDTNNADTNSKLTLRQDSLNDLTSGNSILNNSGSSILDGLDDSILDNSEGSILDNSEGSILDNSNDSILDNLDGSILDNSNDSIFDNLDGSILDNSDDSIFDNLDGNILDNSNDSILDNSNSSVSDKLKLYNKVLEKLNEKSDLLNSINSGKDVLESGVTEILKGMSLEDLNALKGLNLENMDLLGADLKEQLEAFLEGTQAHDIGIDINYVDMVQFFMGIVNTYSGLDVGTELSSIRDLAAASSLPYTMNSDGRPFMILPATLKDGDSSKNIYLVVLGGTEFEDGQATGVMEDLLTAFGLENDYLASVREGILENVPKGSDIVLTGISLGGMMSQQLAADDVIKDRYNIVKVLAVATSNIKPYDVECDVIRIVEKVDIVPKLSWWTMMTADANTESNYKIVEDGGYKTALGAHALGYVADPAWAEYDVLGIKGGTAKIELAKAISDGDFYRAQQVSAVGDNVEKFLNEAFKNTKNAAGMKKMLTGIRYEVVQAILSPENLKDLSNLFEIAQQGGLTNPEGITDESVRALAEEYVGELKNNNVTDSDLKILETVLSSENLEIVGKILKIDNLSALAELINLVDMDDLRAVTNSVDEEALVNLIASLTKDHNLAAFINSIGSDGGVDVDALTALAQNIDTGALLKIVAGLDKDAMQNIISVVTHNPKLVARVMNMSSLAGLLEGMNIDFDTILEYVENFVSEVFADYDADMIFEYLMKFYAGM